MTIDDLRYGACEVGAGVLLGAGLMGGDVWVVFLCGGIFAAASACRVRACGSMCCLLGAVFAAAAAAGGLAGAVFCGTGAGIMALGTRDRRSRDRSSFMLFGAGFAVGSVMGDALFSIFYALPAALVVSALVHMPRYAEVIKKQSAADNASSDTTWMSVGGVLITAGGAFALCALPSLWGKVLSVLWGVCAAFGIQYFWRPWEGLCLRRYGFVSCSVLGYGSAVFMGWYCTVLTAAMELSGLPVAASLVISASFVSMGTLGTWRHHPRITSAAGLLCCALVSASLAGATGAWGMEGVSLKWALLCSAAAVGICIGAVWKSAWGIAMTTLGPMYRASAHRLGYVTIAYAMYLGQGLATNVLGAATESFASAMRHAMRGTYSPEDTAALVRFMSATLGSLAVSHCLVLGSVALLMSVLLVRFSPVTRR